MPGSATLQGSEFVGHVFVVADGPARDADHRYLLGLWRRCCDQFGITEEIPDHSHDPPDDLASAPGPGGVLAARRSTGPGMHQMVLRRLPDVFCLAVLRAPAATDGLGWLELDAQWSSVLRQPTSGVIGSSRILQARLADPAGVPAVTDALGAVVRVAVPATGAPKGWWKSGTVLDVSPSDRFAVWEVSDQPVPPATWNGRAHRRIVVVAPAGGDAALSAWTWSRGDPEITPFARYLLHAAKARYELRVWETGQGFRRLRADTDEVVAALLRMVSDASEAGRAPDRPELMAASVRLVGLQAGELGLVDRSTRLREMRRTVAIAAANMTSYAPDDQPGGLFADDRMLVSWLDRQLDHDATYLEAARDRAREVGALTDQLVQRGQQRRQELFNLGLTGIVGAILMVLAAIGSLRYTVPVPAPVKPAVVGALGAFAILVSMVVLRVVVPERRWTWLAVCVATALLGAAVAWIATSALALGNVAVPGVSWVWGGVGAVGGFLIAVVVTMMGRMRQ